jgi:hypothetical protein
MARATRLGLDMINDAARAIGRELRRRAWSAA